MSNWRQIAHHYIQRRDRELIYSYTFFNLGATWKGGGVPRQRDGTHCRYKRLEGPQGLYERVGNNSPPPGFEHRNIQPLQSRFTDYVTPLVGYKLVNSDSLSHPISYSWLYPLFRHEFFSLWQNR